MTTTQMTIAFPFAIIGIVFAVYLVSRVAALGFWKSYFQAHRESMKEEDK